MKKTIITLTILFGMSIGLSAQGGMFGYGETRSSGSYEDNREQSFLHLPSSHGGTGDDAGTGAPLGSGLAVLIGLGAAYALTKKRNN